MARIHGKKGQVLLDSTPASPVTPVAVADLNDWTLDMSTDRVDVTAFGDTNKQKVSGLPDFSGTVGGFWNSVSSPTFFAIVLGGVTSWLRLMPSTAEPTYYFEGLANLDGSIKVSANGAVTISGKFDAAGNWVQKP